MHRQWLHQQKIKERGILPANYVSISQFATANRATVAVINRYIHDGKLRYIKIGSYRYVDGTQRLEKLKPVRNLKYHFKIHGNDDKTSTTNGHNHDQLCSSAALASSF